MQTFIHRRFQRLSVGRKLTAISLLISSAALIVAAAMLMAYDITTARSRLVRDVGVLADVVGRNSTGAIAFADAEEATKALQGVSVDSHIVAAAIVLPGGSILASYHRDPAAAPADTVPSFAAATTKPWSAFTGGTLQVLRPVELASEQVAVVFIESDLADLQSRGLAYVGMLGLILIGASGVSLVLSARLQRVISQPIHDLTGIMRAVTRERRYDLRATSSGGDEIGELVDGFNEMLSEIQQRDVQLLAHRHDLEATVEARTAELRAANHDLIDARDGALEA